MQNILFTDSPKDSLNVMLVFEGESHHIKEAPKSFRGKKLETSFLPGKHLFMVGLGKKEDIELDYYRRAAAKAVKTASTFKISGIHFLLKHPLEKNCVALLEGASLSNYVFDKYKSKEDKMFRVKHYSFPSKAKSFSHALHDTLKVCENVYLVRDLVSDNSSVVTPAYLEKTARKISNKSKIKFHVLQDVKLKSMGMNLLHGVGQAGLVPPRLIVLEYYGSPADTRKKTMFVGKGITFDSGGLNIKFGNSMKDMQMDMAGAAIVLGIIKSAADLKLKKNIIVLMPCAENLVDNKSQRPGEVIESYSGLTVENGNTDAEGRLVLADALAYGTKKYKPDLVIEYSTLTGAIVAALGSHCAGMMTTSEKLGVKMFEAGMKTYERVWEMPLFEEYLDETKGEKSDLKSMNKTKYNGSIFAGAFLSKFVNDVPFIHLDVAGTAMLDEPKDYQPKDGSGFGVRLAIEFLKN